MRILLIEDDQDLSEAMAVSLQKGGHTVDINCNGEDGLQYALQGAYELILLDRMLPGRDGLSILKELRRQGIASPVIMVTAMNAIGDRVDGLDGGADDYLVKPFAMEELLARVRALSRRPQQWESSSLVEYGDAQLNSQLHFLKCFRESPKECQLSKREAQLLDFFFHNPGQILPRDLLLTRVWGPDALVEDGNLDNYIHFLRRRLKSVGSSLKITTIRSVGYRLEQADTPC